MLAASKNSAYSPAPETYSFTRNTQPLEFQVEALEEKQRNELSPHTKVESFSGFREEVGNEFPTLQNHFTSGPHFTDDEKGTYLFGSKVSLNESFIWVKNLFNFLLILPI